MGIRAFVVFVSGVALAGAAFATGARDSAGDAFFGALLSTPHDAVLTHGEFRGQGGRPFMIANPGTASAFVIGCEEACTSVRVELHAAALRPLVGESTPDHRRSVVLALPSQYARSLSNFEIRITLGCRREGGCNYDWALLGAGSYPTPAQRGMRAAPSDAEWNASAPADGAPPAAALNWLARPTGDDLRFFYPVPAWNSNRSGSARLQCLALADGGLRCRVRDETPAGAGFGEAALGLSTLLRIAAVDAAGQPTLNRRVEIPVQFSRTQ